MRKDFDTVHYGKNISRLHYGSDSLEGQARRYFQFEVKLGKKKDMCYKNSTPVLLTWEGFNSGHPCTETYTSAKYIK